MARIRSVHPALFTDEAWVSCSPLARILYIGLWTDADDQGLFEWKPLQIKMRLLPGDMAETGSLLSELSEAGLICVYEDNGKKYGAIRNFRKFQRPQKPNAIHPLPDRIASYVGLSPNDPEPVAEEYATGSGNANQMEDVGGKREEIAAALPAEEPVRVADPVKDDWPEVDGDGNCPIAVWAAKLTSMAGPGLADPSKVQGLLLSSPEIGRWRQAGCSWEGDVVPVIRARTAQPRARPINAWTYFTEAILDQASRRKASLVIPLHPEGAPHVRKSARTGSDRQANFVERLSRIDAAMAAAVEQSTG